MPEDPRAGLLRKMVAYELPVDPTVKALAELPYDCDSDLVVVASADILRMVDRSVQRELSLEQLVEWADFLEVRDGVGFAAPHSDRLKEIVWELANPELSGEITQDRLSKLREELAGLAT